MSTSQSFREHIDSGYKFKGDYITLGAAMLDGKTLTNTLIKVPLKQ
jgi:hypothetical protein